MYLSTAPATHVGIKGTFFLSPVLLWAHGTILAAEADGGDGGMGQRGV